MILETEQRGEFIAPCANSSCGNYNENILLLLPAEAPLVCCGVCANPIQAIRAY
jgi:hypothetical protein